MHPERLWRRPSLRPCLAMCSLSNFSCPRSSAACTTLASQTARETLEAPPCAATGFRRPIQRESKTRLCQSRRPTAARLQLSALQTQRSARAVSLALRARPLHLQLHPPAQAQFQWPGVAMQRSFPNKLNCFLWIRKTFATLR